MFYQFIEFQCVSTNTVVHETRKLTNEKRLIKDLLGQYQVKWGRPVNNMSETVVVYFGINLVQLLDLVIIYIDVFGLSGLFFRYSSVDFEPFKDEKNQVLVSNVYSLYVRLQQTSYYIKEENPK